MDEPIYFDDAEAFLVQHLNPLIGSPVATQRPTTDRADFVRVSRVGGPASSPFMDSPMLTIECYGATDGEAYELCKAVRGEVLAMNNRRIGNARVSGLYETGGPAYFPDPQATNLHRYQMTVSLDIRWTR